MRPCLTCGELSRNTRCAQCTSHREAAIRDRKPYHHGPEYRRRRKRLLKAAYANPDTRCHLCGELANPDDPWSCDHVNAGDMDSPLAIAHRSCNSRRGNRPLDPQ